MAAFELVVTRREQFGSNAMGRLRRSGQVPAILYGMEKEPVPLTVEAEKLEQLLHSSHGENAIFELSLSGTDMRRPVMIKEVQRHPLRGHIEHCDFIRISLDEPVNVRVPVSLTGVSNGVKNMGGICEFLSRDLGIQCLPKHIPEMVEIDITPLGIHDAIRVQDVVLPEGVEATDTPSHIVVHIVPPKVEKEVAVAAEAEEEAAEEPEVIKKGKEDESEAAAAEPSS